MTTPRERWREAELDELRRRTLATPAPVVLSGPPGAGKTTLLHALAADLDGAFVLDLFGAASTPERLLLAAARALRPLDAAAAAGLEASAAGGREAATAGVRSLFDLWRDMRRPLLLDEPTEIRSLAYFPGLRDVTGAFGAALASRAAPTVVASSYGFATRRLWPGWEAMTLGPLDERSGLDPALLRVTFGWPRYVRQLGTARDARTAWIEAMSPGGTLETTCRATYETLLLRSRGYGITKALLAVLAEHEPLTLTTAVLHLGRTTGAVRDYLEWLLLVDAAVVHTRRYFYADGLVRLWVRLHAQGTPPSVAELEQAFETASRSDERAALMADRRRTPRAAPVTAPEPPPEPLPRRRPDTLVEID